MRFDMAALSDAQRYKLMAGTIVPRPIAWVSTLSEDGIGNLAPYSFFNMMGSSPPLVVLGTMRQHDGRLKDTAANILATREFVVHLVSEAMLPAMNATCIDAPAEVDEAALAGLTMEPSQMVAPPSIAGAPARFECRLHDVLDAAPGTVILIGEVVAMEVADAFIDPESLRADPYAMGLIARVTGTGTYTRIAPDLTAERPVWGG
ncbi:flavin reductase family protein [Erythrobacter sp. WG]|uniref:flavin reductase family protein n=1 Tax=Erythrobacter sp. WG TaxID=2985510 RepID=UPI00226F2027|nr:flavin reductase family protein [Erythrobacter sp. WG]MCX9148750.1 flavin reductase family protein [Erythrobacter sp. WG]